MLALDTLILGASNDMLALDTLIFGASNDMAVP